MGIIKAIFEGGDTLFDWQERIRRWFGGGLGEKETAPQGKKEEGEKKPTSMEIDREIREFNRTLPSLEIQKEINRLISSSGGKKGADVGLIRDQIAKLEINLATAEAREATQIARLDRKLSEAEAEEAKAKAKKKKEVLRKKQGAKDGWINALAQGILGIGFFLGLFVHVLFFFRGCFQADHRVSGWTFLFWVAWVAVWIYVTIHAKAQKLKREDEDYE